MRTLTGIFLALALAGSLLAQRGAAPFVAGAPGNTVFPAGTAATNPFITFVTPNVVYPGGGGPHYVVPGTTPRVPRSNFLGAGAYGYSYYVPDYDPSMYAAPQAAAGPPQGQSSPNIIVVYPPSSAMPVMPPQEVAHPQMQVYQPDTGQPAQASSDEETTPFRYLLAFKNHSIYSVVAYWVDGDTIHYFTSGNTHKQAPLSSLDRDLTLRLNKESGSDFSLPPAK